MFPVDLDALGDDDLVAALREIEAEHRKIETRRAALVEALDRRKVYRVDGHASVHGLVRTIARCPTAESKDLLRRGRLARRYADVAAAASAGEVGIAQLARMGRAAEHPRCGDAFDEVVDIILGQVNRLKYSEFDTLVARWEVLADVDGANQRAEASHDNRDAWITVLGGGFHGELRGSAVMGVAMKEILDRFVQTEWQRDWEWTKSEFGAEASPARMPRSDQQRRADALYAIFRAAASTPADAKAPEPVVDLLGDPATFCRVLAIFFGIDVTAEQDRAASAVVPFEQRRCETSTGVPVAPDELLAAAIVGWVRRAVVDTRGVVIDYGRKQRLFSGDARLAAHLGRTRCFWPGCEVPAARCHTDHLTDWQHFGSTCPEDGEPCCPHHNWLKQNRGYLTVRGDDGRIHVFRPNGTKVA